MKSPWLQHFTAHLEFPICGVPVEFPVDVEYTYQAYEAPSFDSPGAAASIEIASARVHAEPLLDRMSAEQIESLKQQAFEHEGICDERDSARFEDAPVYTREFSPAALNEMRREILAGDVISRNRRA